MLLPHAPPPPLPQPRPSSSPPCRRAAAYPSCHVHGHDWDPHRRLRPLRLLRPQKLQQLNTMALVEK
eukprot:12716622-Heterocapsa_arctica.AAC.1